MKKTSLVSDLSPFILGLLLFTFRLSFAQLPAGTPTYNVNAKWVTDRGSQVFNVKAYGATGNGTTDDTAAINATFTAAAGAPVLFPPGNYVVTSELVWPTSYQTVEGYGANILCDQSAGPCAYIGITSSNTTGVVVQGLGFIPGPNSSTASLIVDNSQSSHFIDLHGGTQAPSACSSQAGSVCHYGHFIENDNDQAMTIDHLHDVGQAVCTGTACGSAVYGASGGSNAGIAYIQNSNLSMGCNGNGIDWETGNHLTISNTVLQAWSQFALRGTSAIDIHGNTHWEQGSCTNPLNDGSGHALGGASIISLGGAITVEGGLAPLGNGGTQFATSASGGSTIYAYYVVGHYSSAVTAPLLVGFLVNGPATISGSAEVFAVWPALALSNVTTFDLLRTTGGAPYGTGNYAIATGLAVGTYCTASSGQVCAYTDNVGTPSSYTVGTEGWYPGDTFWPGNLVLFQSGGAGSSNSFGTGSYTGPAIPFGVVNSAPSDFQAVHVTFTGTSTLLNSGYPTGPGLIAMGNQYYANNQSTAQLFPRGAANFATKGYQNFGTGGLAIAQDFVTINDRNWAKTLADFFKHPTFDAADSALCGDPPTSTGICLRGPTVSQYINTLPDGSHWATRTYSTGIADAVPRYGLSTTSAGAPNTPTLTDESSGTTCLTSHTYSLNAVCFDGTNFELVIWATSTGSDTTAVAPTWATTPGQTTIWGNVTFECLGTGSLAANTAYFIETAGCTVGGCGTASAEATITTANDGAAHMILPTGTAKAGHTSYQVFCSTTTGTEAKLTAPFTGAYTGNGYVLPVMGCSGSGSPSSSDQTGYANVLGMCFNGANCNTSWPATGYATVDANGTAQTQRNTLNLISGSGATVSCADNSGASRTDCTVASTSTSLPASSGYRGTTDGAVGSDTSTHTYWFGVNGNSWPLCLPLDFSCSSGIEDWLHYTSAGTWPTTTWFYKYAIGSNVTNPTVVGNGAIWPDAAYVSFTSDATSGHGYQIRTGYVQVPLSGAGNWLVKMRFKQPQAATDETNGEIFQIGVAASPGTGSYPSMLGVALNTTLGDTAWVFQTDNGTARTTQATGASLDNNFHSVAIGRITSGEYFMQFDAGTVYCFTTAASGGCTTEGTVTVVNSAHLPAASGFALIGIPDEIAESANAVEVYLGRVAYSIRGFSTP